VGGTGSAEPTSLGWYLPAGWRLASRIALHRELAADRAAAGSAGRGVLTGALLQLASLPGGDGRGQPGPRPSAVLLAFARTDGLVMLRMISGAPGADGSGRRARAPRLPESPGSRTWFIKDSDKLSATRRAELRGVISTKPGLNRYLRTTPGGLLRIDAKAIKAEGTLDGKYLLRTSDPHLPAEDIALGYKQLLEVERGWRDMKQVIDLRPVYHRKEQRIRAHVILCWLALLLVRIAETTCRATWPGLRRDLGKIALGTFTGPAGTFRQRTELSKTQRDILAQLKIDPPPRIYQLTTETP